MKKDIVVIGILGTVTDNNTSDERWNIWRPTVSLALKESFPVKRLDLIYDPAIPNNEEGARCVAYDFNSKSPSSDIKLHRHTFPKPWDFVDVYAELLNFAHNYKFDIEHEDYFVHITTGTHVMQICLFLLVESRIIPAKLLQTYSLRDGPNGAIKDIDLDLSKYNELAKRFEEKTAEGIHYLKSGINTRNKNYNHMIDELATVSVKSKAPILITGPSGVGKTRLARLIYEWKKNNHKVTGSFVEVNCATLKGTSAMSALFGHVKGAYTGASDKRLGLIAAADKGLLFLDEIGELGLDEQAMLLRAIEDKHFYPLGSDKEISSDFQLICGTNADIKKMVAEGKFRADLLARINLWSFRLMSLKDRIEDLEPNLMHELEKASESLGTKIRMNKEAHDLFIKEATAPDALWTGNFRELSGSAMRMSVLSDCGRITIDNAREELSRLQEGWREEEALNNDSFPLIKAVLDDQEAELDLFDKAQLEYVIKTCQKSKSMAEAGRRLFANSIKQRASSNDSDRLRKYLAKFNLSWDAVSKPL